MEVCREKKPETGTQQRVFADRKRTNILCRGEQLLICFLLKYIPDRISPNKLTAIGFLGSVIVFLAFLLSKYHRHELLLLGIAGLLINWLGDSLDGRLAYYRNTPRKWYGFALDIMMDWFSIVLIGLGYYFYEADGAKILAFLFVIGYGWSMLIALLRYKIANVYRIDSGLLGPTELRLIIALILTVETLLPHSIKWFGVVTTLSLFAINTKDSFKILKDGNTRDRAKCNHEK